MASTRITHVEGGIGRAAFEQCFYRPRVPVVISGAAPQWRAYDGWSFRRLAANLGELPIRIHLADGSVFRETSSELGTFSTFEQRARGDLIAGAKGVVNLPVERLGDLCTDVAPLPEALPRRAHVAQMWASPRGAVTALHYDLSDAFVVQVCGRKRWVLFAPQDWRKMYARSLLDRRNYHSRVDIEEPDLRSFPAFRLARRHEAVVGPGDAIFVPAPWWHQVYSLDEENISVHYRWICRRPRVIVQPSVLRQRLCNLYHGRFGTFRRWVVRTLLRGTRGGPLETRAGGA